MPDGEDKRRYLMYLALEDDPSSLTVAQLRAMAMDENPETLGRVADEAIGRLEET